MDRPEQPVPGRRIFVMNTPFVVYLPAPRSFVSDRELHGPLEFAVRHLFEFDDFGGRPVAPLLRRRARQYDSSWRQLECSGYCCNRVCVS
jgi:hypothetical protein